MAEPSDNDLLRRARRDPDAFCAFYDRHATQLHAWLRRESGDPEAALDLTAEAFAQALRSLRRFRGDHDDSGRAWLYAIARNLLRRWRATGRLETRARRRLGIAVADPGVEEEVASRLDGEAARSELSAAMGALPADQRDAVRLRVLDGLPYAAVATQLGCSPVAARIRVSRGLRRLGRALDGGQP
jgi:RNA polymerase sigma factor (sigma-70 family)